MPITRDTAGSDRLRAQLLGPRRHDVLSLDEVIEAGRVFTGDPDGLAFYGLAPTEWYLRGIRLLGRTCVEATPDVTARPIAVTVRELLAGHTRDRGRVGVVDLFAGSGNLMLHVARALGAPACGLDADEAVWARTAENLRIIGELASVRRGDWLSYFAEPVEAETVVYVLSPPWGAAFSFATGLDLTRTEPPLPRIVETIAARDRSRQCYAVVQHTPLEPVVNVAALAFPVLGRGPGCIVLALRDPSLASS